MVLPEPVAPTSATVSPGARSRLTSRSTSSSGASGKAKSTCSNRRWPRGRSTTRVPDDDVGLGVEDLEDAGAGGHRLLRHREDDAQRGDRPDERQHEGDEGDQLAGGERAAADADRAEQQDHHDGEVGDHLEEAPEPRRQPDLVHARVVQLLGGGVVLEGDVLAAAEGLDHPDADGALLGEGGEVALLVLHPAGDDDVGLLEAHREPHDRRRGGGDDQAERPVHLQQHDRDDGDLEDVDHEEQQPEAAEPPDRGRGRWSPARAAGRTATCCGSSSAAAGAARRGRAASAVSMPSTALDWTQRRQKISTASRTPERQGQQPERQHRAEVALGDRAVDQRLGDQRDRDRETDPGQRGAEHDRQRPAVGLEIAPQPPQGVDACGRVGIGWSAIVRPP